MKRQFILIGIGLIALFGLFGCQDTDPKASARRIATRTELIGGPSALGEVGDFIIENNRIRIVVQDKGFSRGFGIYGGGLIDVDRVRGSSMKQRPARGEDGISSVNCFPLLSFRRSSPTRWWY